MKWYERFYWRLVGYVEVNVKWPSGKIVVDHNDPRWVDLGGAVWVELDSADPNDYYRPFLQEWIGKQSWDWAWYLNGHDISENRLTIRMRKKHAIFATQLALMWG